MASSFRILIVCISFLFLLSLHAEWHNPPYAFSSSTHGRRTQVSTDSLGNAVALWEEGDSNNKVILSSSFNAKTLFWTQPVLVSDQEGHFKDPPKIRMNSQGMAIAAFRDSNVPTIQANVYNGNGSWSGVENFFDEGAESAPIVAMGGKGMGIVCWVSSIHGIQLVTYRNGYFSHCTTIDSSTKEAYTPLSIALNERGKGILAWIKEGDIYCSFLQASCWSVPSKVTKLNGISSLDVGIDAEGNAILVFQKEDTINSKRYSEGKWSSTEELSQENSHNEPPKLFVSGGGTAVALWRSIRDQDVLESAFFDGVWMPSTICPVDKLSEYSITGDTLGNILVAYSLNQGNVHELKSTYYFKSLGWSTPVSIACSEKQIKKPSIALSTFNHRAFSSWDEGDNTDAFGSFSILAVPPSPPSSFEAKVKKDRFPSQTDRIHILTWNQTTDPTAIFYRIKQGKNVLSEYSVKRTHRIELHNRDRKVTTTYSICSVNALGIEGPPKTISIR